LLSFDDLIRQSIPFVILVNRWFLILLLITSIIRSS
jgi:hypothetical protein